MRTFAGVTPLAQSLKWIEDKNLKHLHLIIDTDKGSADYGKCVKLGSINTVEQYRIDNAEKASSWVVMSYATAKDFHRDNGGQSSTDSTTSTTSSQSDESDTVDTTDDDKTASTPKPVQRRVEYGTDKGIKGANAIAELIQTAINGAMDIDSLRALAEEKINEAVRGLVSPTIISYQPSAEAEPIPVGCAHKNFPLLLQMVQARDKQGNRLNILLKGPAGTSKSTAAKQVAKALGMKFYPMSAIDSKFELFGFVDANGKTVRTAFREVWEHGGVFCFDELSASSAQAFVAFNGCLANGIAPFPDGAIERHPDCIIIAGDNVFGAPTAEYNGRNKMDAASMDRFIPVDWDIDPVLERAITGNDSWVDLVQSVRQAVEDKGIRGVIITPRSSVNGEALLRAGIDRKTVARLTMKKSMTDDQWALIERTVGL